LPAAHGCGAEDPPGQYPPHGHGVGAHGPPGGQKYPAGQGTGLGAPAGGAKGGGVGVGGGAAVQLRAVDSGPSAAAQPHTLKLSLAPDSMQNTPSADGGHPPAAQAVYPQQLLLLGLAPAAQPGRYAHRTPKAACPAHGHCPPPLDRSLLTTHSRSCPCTPPILLPSHDAAWHRPVAAQHRPAPPPAQPNSGSCAGSAQPPPEAHAAAEPFGAGGATTTDVELGQ
jgi:hypothetical protein